MSEFESEQMKQGKLDELERDGIVIISEVTYDAKKDAENVIHFDDQEPIEKKVISTGNPFIKHVKQADNDNHF